MNKELHTEKQHDGASTLAYANYDYTLHCSIVKGHYPQPEPELTFDSIIPGLGRASCTAIGPTARTKDGLKGSTVTLICAGSDQSLTVPILDYFMKPIELLDLSGAPLGVTVRVNRIAFTVYDSVKRAVGGYVFLFRKGQQAS